MSPLTSSLPRTKWCVNPATGLTCYQSCARSPKFWSRSKIKIITSDLDQNSKRSKIIYIDLDQLQDQRSRSLILIFDLDLDLLTIKRLKIKIIDLDLWSWSWSFNHKKIEDQDQFKGNWMLARVFWKNMAIFCKIYWIWSWSLIFHQEKDQRS